MPIFFGLFRVLYNKLPQAAEGDAFGPLTTELANSAYNGSFLGAVTISNSFLSSGDGGIITKIVAGLIIASMCTRSEERRVGGECWSRWSEDRVEETGETSNNRQDDEQVRQCSRYYI